ncbi:tail fiber domain-containing protein [Roseivivax sp. CAU 1753]
MKKLLMTTALSLTLAATSVLQASAAPVMSRDTVRQATISTQSNQESSATWGVIALMTILIIIAVAASGSGGDHYYHGVTMSDERLKTDIKRVGTSPSGIGIFQYRYIGHPQVVQGAIAQDVARVRPAAVGRGDMNLLTVNYDMIDVRLRLVN